MAVVTVEEAQTKWCPNTPRTYAPDGAVHPGGMCLTTGCMLWNGDDTEGECGLTALPGEAAAPPDGGGADPAAPNTWSAPQTYENTLVLAPMTFAELPVGAAATPGLRSFCTDSSTGAYGQTVAGGGTTHAPVWYDDSSASWRVG